MKLLLDIKIYTIIIIGTFLGCVSCNSPLEVPANRDINLKENPFSNPVITITPNYNFLDFVHPDSTKTIEIKISNNLDKSYPISEYHFYWSNNNFKLLNKSFPIILGPKGSENASTVVQVIFTAKSVGSFNDTLIVNNLTYPKAIVEARVPYIFVNDLHADSITTNSKYFGKIVVRNLSSNSAIVKSCSISQFAELFSFENIFPLEVPRNSSAEIPFEFLAKNGGAYSVKITFDIESLSLKSLIDNSSIFSIDVFP